MQLVAKPQLVSTRFLALKQWLRSTWNTVPAKSEGQFIQWIAKEFERKSDLRGKDAFDMAWACYKFEKTRFPHEDYYWDRDAAAQYVYDEMQHWDSDA